jgi:hypothetical protein
MGLFSSTIRQRSEPDNMEDGRLFLNFRRVYKPKPCRHARWRGDRQFPCDVPKISASASSASSTILHGGLDGWSASIASPEVCYRTKYMRSELPRTTSPTIGTINSQLVHARSANWAGT